jgi:hypothetical protein
MAMPLWAFPRTFWRHSKFRSVESNGFYKFLLNTIWTLVTSKVSMKL